MKLKLIPAIKLFISEPDPRWFGNPPNDIKNPNWDTSRSKNWLQSRFHFSFAEYSNNKNSNFGAIRVMNDDFVQPDRGFGSHDHSNMEIVTYIVEGILTHKDSMGTEESLGRGSVQFMTAGKGIRHSEYNLDHENGLRFIQTWIVPRRNGFEPKYGSFNPRSIGSNENDVCYSRNKWRHLVSDSQNKSAVTPVKIEQDVNLYVAELDQGETLTLNFHAYRMAYVLCVEGSTKLSDGNVDMVLRRHDGCEITPGLKNDRDGDRSELMFEALISESSQHVVPAHILVFEMEFVFGAGRQDF